MCERRAGLLGVEVDPNFGDAGNNFIYLYYTFKGNGNCATSTTELRPRPSKQELSSCRRLDAKRRVKRCRREARREATANYADPAQLPVNRVARFTMSGSEVTPASEVVLLDKIPSLRGNHNGGDLAFDPDGLLYVSVGDSGCQVATRVERCSGSNQNAQYPNLLNGKILRITPDGDIPGGNAYDGPGVIRCKVSGRAVAGQKCAEIFALGLRNPFRIAFDPNAPRARFYINDVGQGTWEEIDEGQQGANYGWNYCEGRFVQGSTTKRCNSSSFEDPVHAYGRANNCGSITGGAFVPNQTSGANDPWNAYRGDYLYADFKCARIFAISPPNGSGFVGDADQVRSGLGRITVLAFNHADANDTNLYFATYSGLEGPGVYRFVP